MTLLFVGGLVAVTHTFEYIYLHLIHITFNAHSQRESRVMIYTVTVIAIDVNDPI